MVGFLATGARRFGNMARVGAEGRQRLIRIAVAAFAMGAGLWFMNAYCANYIDTTVLRIFYAPALILAGFLLYALFASISGAITPADLKLALKRN